jgi:hypothetical protein
MHFAHDEQMSDASFQLLQVMDFVSFVSLSLSLDNYLRMLVNIFIIKYDICEIISQ